MAWTDDACADAGTETNRILIQDRQSGRLTEVTPGHWISLAGGSLLGLDVFGPRALIDIGSLEYVGGLRQEAVDVRWSTDLRYAAVSFALGHGGPCG